MQSANTIVDAILKMKTDGDLPNRKKLLKDFQLSIHCISTNEWFLNCNNLLVAIRNSSLQFQDLQKHPFHSVLYTHLIRLQRYMLGLSRLSWIHDNGKPIAYHAIDSFYPILKSVYEVTVEFCLSLAYRNEFCNQKNWDHKLSSLIISYTEFSKKKNNYKYWFDNVILEEPLPEELMPSNLVE